LYRPKKRAEVIIERIEELFIYCRKSSEDEDRQVLSIEAQLRELKEYAEKCGLQIVDTLTESKSAHKPGREVFNGMMARIDLGEADAILSWQINRLARNAKDGGDIIWAMDEGKIKQIDTSHKQFKNNGDDKFFMTLEFGMAKKYSDDLSDNKREEIGKNMNEVNILIKRLLTISI
jgi:DNA invertase Pin-like site-specific DNA recombinase